MEIALPHAAAKDDDIDVRWVYDQTADFVWRSLQRMGIAESDLEDVQQEVYIVVHRRLASYDRACRLTTWLFGIALRVARRHRERAYNRRERVVESLPETIDETTPERVAELARARRAARELLDTLSPVKRATFVLFELEHYGCEEIAEMTGVPVGTVHSRLHAARRDLQRTVARWKVAGKLPGAA